MANADPAVEAAREYLDAGLAVVPIARGAKGPKDTSWPQKAAAREYPPEAFAGMNVGVVLGSISCDLVDVDLDDPHAIALAPYFLDATVTFGRASKPESHWLYTAPGARSAKYQTSPGALIEIRANNASGDACGHQTVFPGSVHKSGEPVEWTPQGRGPTEICTIDPGRLKWDVQRLAFFSTLLSTWTEGRHEKSLQVSGFLLKEGWSEDEVREGMRIVREVAGDSDAEHADFGHDVESSIKKAREGGLEYLKGLGDLFDPKIAKALHALAETPEARLSKLTGISKYGSPRGVRRMLQQEAIDHDRDAGALAAADEIVAGLGSQIAPAPRALPPPDTELGGYTAEAFDGFDVPLRRHACGLKCPLGKETPYPSETNVVDILIRDPRWNGLCFDTFAQRVLIKDPPMRRVDTPDCDVSGEWTDAHTMRLMTWLDEQYDMRPARMAVDSAVEVAARRRSFHPVRSYIDSLTWDGRARCESWLSTYLGAEPTPYTRAVGRAFLISMIARIREPGCQVDTVLVLEGPQGARKSSALRTLAGNAWFTDSAIDMRSRDGHEKTQGVWLVELAELDSIARAELSAVKAFISERSPRYRVAFGRRTQNFPRQCVFAGTTNETNYLADSTGNRRFWPVSVGFIDLAALTRDRDQLWAEAQTLYDEGERWWLAEDDEDHARVEQAERGAAALDPWLPVIEEYLARPIAPPGMKPRTVLGAAQAGASNRPAEITTTILLEQALGILPRDHDRRATTRMGCVLRELGWFPKQRQTDGKRQRFYEYRPDLLPGAEKAAAQ